MSNTRQLVRASSDSAVYVGMYELDGEFFVALHDGNANQFQNGTRFANISDAGLRTVSKPMTRDEAIAAFNTRAGLDHQGYYDERGEWHEVSREPGFFEVNADGSWTFIEA